MKVIYNSSIFSSFSSLLSLGHLNFSHLQSSHGTKLEFFISKMSTQFECGKNQKTPKSVFCDSAIIGNKQSSWTAVPKTLAIQFHLKHIY